MKISEFLSGNFHFFFFFFVVKFSIYLNRLVFVIFVSEGKFLDFYLLSQNR